MSNDAWMLAVSARPQPAIHENVPSAPHSRPAKVETKLDTSRPVLIIDGGACADLGLVRSLGFERIPVHLLTSGRSSITTRSRYVTQTHAFPRPSASDAECVARIRAVAKSLRSRPVVLASGDWALRFLSRCRADFADVLDHDLPDPHVVASSLDNARFEELAQRLSLRVRTSWVPRDQRQFARQCSELVSVQVYVEPSGRILGSFTGVEEQVRHAAGAIGGAVISRRNEQLAALAVDIVSNLEYSGFAILQFRRESAQDAFRLVEINCRYGTWTEMPSRCGCNFPVAAYATITGQSAPALVQREGVPWWTFLALDDPAPFVWQLLRRKAD